MLCRIVGAPVQDGAGRMGCEMGPSALRTAGLVSALRELGHEVEDLGTVERAVTRSHRAWQSGAEGAAGDLGLDLGNRRAGLCGKP